MVKRPGAPSTRSRLKSRSGDSPGGGTSKWRVRGGAAIMPGTTSGSAGGRAR
jgi:hypothetical protein